MSDTTPWCRDCRWAKMVHCSDVWYGCSGMKYLPKSDARVQKALDPATDRDEAHKLMDEVWNEYKHDSTGATVPVLRAAASDAAEVPQRQGV